MFALRTIALLALISLVIPFGPAGAAGGKEYPTRPITLVSPTGPGMQDTMARIMCKAAEKELGVPIVVENKTGAAGTIGVNYVLKSKPDGYTLGSAVTSAYNIIPHMRKVPYNPFTDAIDITTVYKYNFGLAVRTDSPWKTFEELVAYVQKNPGKFTYSTAGVGRPQHICMEQIALKKGLKWTHIPFNSGGESVTACLGGHADGTSQGSADLIPHIKAGKLRMLLTLDDRRWPAYPDVPNILEKEKDICALSYGSIFVPKGVPENIVRILSAAFNKAKKDPAFIESIGKFQVEIGAMDGKEYSELWKSKYEEMGKIIQHLGLKEK